jgi:O-antigen/teichoic acid export membrane protein
MLAASAAAAAAAYAAGVWVQRRRLPTEVRTAKPTYETSTWLRASRHFAVLNGANVLMLNAPLIALTLTQGTAEAALFAMAWKLASLVLYGYGAVNTVLGPATAKLWAEGDREQLQRIVTWTARLALAATLPPAFLFAVAGPVVLGFFGAAYAAAAPTLVILTVGQMLNAGTGNVFLLLSVTGHQSLGARAQVFVALVSIPVAFVLTRAFGASGAALSFAIALVSVNLLWMWLVGRSTGIATTALGVVRGRGVGNHTDA